VQAVAKATGMTEVNLLGEVLSGSTLTDLIKAKNGDVAAVKAAAVAEVTADINKAVESGQLTRQQGDQLISRLDKGFDQMLGVNRSLLISNATMRAKLLQAALKAIMDATKLTRPNVLIELGMGKTPASLITEKGGSVDAVKAAIKDQLTADAKKAVADGKLLQEAADRLLGELDSTIDQLLNNPLTALAGDNAAIRRLQVTSVTALLKQTVTETGLKQREILVSLREGKTLNQIVTDNKADPAKIVAAVQADLTEQVGKLVKNKRITDDQAKTFIANLPNFLNQIMTKVNPLRPNAANAAK
jgi:signal transduction histidine kinase